VRAGHMSVTAAGLLFAILDLLAKPVYSVLLFFLHVHLEENGEEGGDTGAGLLECAPRPLHS
jgi:bacteriorhodopsin